MPAFVGIFFVRFFFKVYREYSHSTLKRYDTIAYSVLSFIFQNLVCVMIGKSFDQLVKSLQCLPTVGAKSARRMALQLLVQKRAQAQALSDHLERALHEIQHCQVCNMLTDQATCSVCSDPTRKATKLCITASPFDVMTLTRLKSYDGLFYVLNGLLSPLDGIGPKQSGLDGLEQHLQTHTQINEILVAFSANMQAQATNFYINNCVDVINSTQQRDIKITTFATGVPVGAELDYLDQQTLELALANRTTMFS